MPRRESAYDGVLLLDKPVGMTSHDVVDAVRKVYRTRRVGHTGTLDPLAEGLLVMCIGRATRIAQYLSDADKEYVATIEFGRTSPTYDAEGIDDMGARAELEVDEDRLYQVLAQFGGEIEQRVPAYSAVRVQGKRLHESARRGETVTPPMRRVTIEELEVLDVHAQQVRLRVRCSKGTYIRSLANDIGEAYGCGAFLVNLRRTAIDKLRLTDAVPLARLEAVRSPEEAATFLKPYIDVLDLPPVRVKPEYEAAIRQGRDVTMAFVDTAEPFHRGDRVALTDAAGRILAIVQAECDIDQLASPSKTRAFKYNRVLV